MKDGQKYQRNHEDAVFPIVGSLVAWLSTPRHLLWGQRHRCPSAEGKSSKNTDLSGAGLGPAPEEALAPKGRQVRGVLTLISLPLWALGDNPQTDLTEHYWGQAWRKWGCEDHFLRHQDTLTRRGAYTWPGDPQTLKPEDVLCVTLGGKHKAAFQHNKGTLLFSFIPPNPKVFIFC